MSTATVARPAMPKRWSLPEENSAASTALGESAQVPPLIAQLLIARGIGTAEAVARYFNPTITQLHPPSDLRGMAEALARLQLAVARGESILIYGDYDVDGTVATVLLKTAIEICGGKALHHIPHRLKEGYGMQDERLAEAAAAGVSLVISVDTGIRAHAACAAAQTLGMDMIVTDHHLPDGDLGVPQAVAVINPNQIGCGYKNKNLCGAGVAFKLAQALLAAHDPIRTREKLLPSFLKVLAIATVADAVPLTGENRAIVALGLRELRRPVNPGLRALMACAELDASRKTLTAMDIAFRIAPRINAAGRMDIASDVVDLLTTRDSAHAQALAEKLHRLNNDRREVEMRIVAAAEEQLGTLGDAPCIVLDGEGWHRGVLGIAASRIVDRTYRPVLVMGHQDGHAHGSGRSIANFHLLDAITTCADLFTSYGGHAHAVGFSLPSANVAELRARMTDYSEQHLSADDRVPELRCAAEMTLDLVSPEIFSWLRAMEPLGMGNPEPLFVARNLTVASPPQIMKEKHLRLRLSQGDRDSRKAVGWNMAPLASALALAAGARIDAIIRMRENEHPDFGGIELELVDLRLSNATGGL